MFNNNNNNKETTMQKTNLKHENVANVGDKIRANDFMPREGRNACYIEGTVIEKVLVMTSITLVIKYL